MRGLRTSFLATTAAIALGGSAYAADLSFKAPAAIAPVPVGMWQGGYIGGSIGVARLNTSASQTFNSEGSGYGACSPASEISSSFGGASCVTSASGLTGGVQIGYDMQSRFFVYGAVADWTWTGLKHTTNFFLSSQPFVRAQVDWLATFRGRMGLAVDDTMVYVTAGLALADIKSGAGQTGDCPTYCYDNSPNKVQAGWVAGVGLEHKLGKNWSMFGEALYYDLGSVTATSTTKDGSFTYSTEFHNEIFQTKLGLNFRF